MAHRVLYASSSAEYGSKTMTNETRNGFVDVQLEHQAE